MIDIQRILIFQGCLVSLSVLILAFLGYGPSAMAFLAGGALSMTNFALLSKLWKGVLDKKPVATLLGIIVTKYAILGGLLYVFVKKWNLSLVPLLVGLSTLVASILLVVLQRQIKEQKG